MRGYLPDDSAGKQQSKDQNHVCFTLGPILFLFSISIINTTTQFTQFDYLYQYLLESGISWSDLISTKLFQSLSYKHNQRFR